MSNTLRIKQFKEGAYAIVAFDKEKKRAIKIFKRAHSEEHAQKVFDSEICAYQIAVATQELKTLVPQFFGAKVFDAVINSNGKDMSSCLYFDLAYEMSYETGCFYKIGTLNSQMTKNIKNCFKENGIHYLIDVSVTIKDDKIVKVIDFAIKEHELWVT